MQKQKDPPIRLKNRDPYKRSNYIFAELIERSSESTSETRMWRKEVGTANGTTPNNPSNEGTREPQMVWYRGEDFQRGFGLFFVSMGRHWLFRRCRNLVKKGKREFNLAARRGNVAYSHRYDQYVLRYRPSSIMVWIADVYDGAFRYLEVGLCDLAHKTRVLRDYFTIRM